jgi:hypothetical protein
VNLALVLSHFRLPIQKSELLLANPPPPVVKSVLGMAQFPPLIVKLMHFDPPVVEPVLHLGCSPPLLALAELAPSGLLFLEPGPLLAVYQSPFYPHPLLMPGRSDDP